MYYNLHHSDSASTETHFMLCKLSFPLTNSKKRNYCASFTLRNNSTNSKAQEYFLTSNHQKGNQIPEVPEYQNGILGCGHSFNPEQSYILSSKSRPSQTKPKNFNTPSTSLSGNTCIAFLKQNWTNFLPQKKHYFS